MVDFVFNIKELFDLYLAPKLLLNDNVIIRSTSDIVKKLPFISKLLKSKFKEGITINTNNNIIDLQIPIIKLDISSDFIKLIKTPYIFEGGDLGLYQDYNIAKGYGYKVPIDDLFDLNQIDLESYFENFDGEILDLHRIYFSEIERNDFIDYISSSMDLLSNKKIKKYASHWNIYIIDFIKKYAKNINNIQSLKTYIFIFADLYVDYLTFETKKYMANVLSKYIINILIDDNGMYYTKLRDILDTSYFLIKETDLINITLNRIFNVILSPKLNISLLKKILYIYNYYNTNFFNNDNIQLIEKIRGKTINNIILNIYESLSYNSINIIYATSKITNDIIDFIIKKFNWKSFKKETDINTIEIDAFSTLLRSSILLINITTKRSKLNLLDILIKLYNVDHDGFFDNLNHIFFNITLKSFSQYINVKCYNKKYLIPALIENSKTEKEEEKIITFFKEYTVDD